jgi:hypothetical protein
MMFQKAPVTGDIVGAYIPKYNKIGQPGPDYRKAMVMALEIDPQTNTLEGLWLCRLSDRLGVNRIWDFTLNASDITGDADFLAEQTWMMRTHQIHLLPLTPEYFGEGLKIYGHADANVLRSFLPKLDHGMQSTLYSDSYGPRDQLHNTIVATSLTSEHQFPHFGYVTLLEDAIKAQGYSSVAPGNRLQEFSNARKQQEMQQRIEARALHHLFMSAGRLEITGSEQARSFAEPQYDGPVSAP